MDVNSFVMHPYYNKKTSENDIALIYVKTNVFTRILYLLVLAIHKLMLGCIVGRPFGSERSVGSAYQFAAAHL